MTTPSSSTPTTTNPIVVEGYKFFDSVTGSAFRVRGVDYYPRPNSGPYNRNSVDFYTEQFRHVWERDVKFLKQLGINAVRLYSVDPEGDHDGFMCALSANGIYAIVGLASSCDGCEIGRSKAPQCYPPELKRRGMKIVDAFAKYPNTLAFSAGNEVNHGYVVEWNAPCQKRFMRDMRVYIQSCDSIRHVPVGIVSADTDRDGVAAYYNCDSDGDGIQNAEWFGLNTYVYCNGKVSDLKDAPGFELLISSFQRYSIPALLTEFGCLSDTFHDIGKYKHQRNFLQAMWLETDPALMEAFSGGFAFEYSEELQNGNRYGIGKFAPDDCNEVEVACQYIPMPEFYNLRNAYLAANRRPNNRTVWNKLNQTFTDQSMQNLMVPDPDRMGRSDCPDQFPTLLSFDWENTSSIPSVCPSKLSQDFVCPASMVSSAKVAEDSMFHHPGAVTWSFVVTALLVIALARGFRDYEGGGTHGNGREDKPDKEDSYHRTDSSSSGEGVPLITTSNVFMGRGGLSDYRAAK